MKENSQQLKNASTIQVVSLVPSLTELAIFLGVNVVGRTKFCIFPEEDVQTIPKVGGTKTVDKEKVIALKPDLVLANKEENVKEQIEALEQAGISVLVTNIYDFHSAIAAILDIGSITFTMEKAQYLATAIQENFKGLTQINKNACYLIWRKPYMTVGGDTFIHSMMEICGIENIFKEQKRYPVIDVAELSSISPELILLSSEPFPFKEQHIKELQAVCPSSKIILVDGTYFSWYGNRMLPAVQYFNKLSAEIQ